MGEIDLDSIEAEIVGTGTLTSRDQLALVAEARRLREAVDNVARDHMRGTRAAVERASSLERALQKISDVNCDPVNCLIEHIIEEALKP